MRLTNGMAGFQSLPFLTNQKIINDISWLIHIIQSDFCYNRRSNLIGAESCDLISWNSPICIGCWEWFWLGLSCMKLRSIFFFVFFSCVRRSIVMREIRHEGVRLLRHLCCCPGASSQRIHDVKTISLWRQNDVTTQKWLIHMKLWDITQGWLQLCAQPMGDGVILWAQA